MSPHVVFADRWLLVAHKPAGLPTQPARGGGSSLLGVVRESHPTATLHHRLDAATSGLVLFTVDPSVNRAVTEAFRQHAIARTYLAVLGGFGRDGGWQTPVDGRPARTDTEVIARRGESRTAMRCTLQTGRTHQIRIQAAMAGTPVLGDRRYDPDGGRAWPRLALHAHTLRWTHPKTGDALNLISPVPDDLQPLWDELAGSHSP